MNTKEKLGLLRADVERRGTLAIAFSGGVDSVFLLKTAVDILGHNVIALTVAADNFPGWEQREAEAFAKALDIRHVIIPWDALTSPDFVENGPDRCYFCKKELLLRMLKTAREHGVPCLADGSNADDDNDYRPGTRAARELGIVSPLREAGLTKREIREQLREAGIAAWDKPSFACLASRFPYGMTITREGLRRVEMAENFFLGMGFRNIRVRHHGDLARIELDASERERFFVEDLWNKVDTELCRIGYRYSALDLRGYRTGSMNESLSLPENA